MKDKEIMTLEKALFILRHGSAEGEHKYFEAITIIENEINRQKAEIERLKGVVDMYEEERKYHFEMSRQRIAEAIKEFAERLKENSIATFSWNGVVLVEEIDNLLKEMVGDNNA